MEELEKELNDENVSPSSSPPTPPSPLPISIGPGNRKYSFSPSPTPSPPFSLPPSSLTSAENLPLLIQTSLPNRTQRPSAFSLDQKVPDSNVDDKTSCIRELVEWFLWRCCCCFTWSPQIFDQRQKQE